MTRRLGAAWVTALVLAACVAAPSPTMPPSPTPTASAAGSAAASASPTAAPPTATPEPTLTLDPPPGADARVVAVTVSPQVTNSGGTIVVAVENRSDTLIDELVLRWPTALAETLFLAPFSPSDERIRDGGDPLVQPWTKWVVGPGEQGEPAGTTSLGWGPIPAATTFEIPIVVTRVASGPVDFDLQVLARNDLLTLDDGKPAELRVSVP